MECTLAKGSKIIDGFVSSPEHEVLRISTCDWSVVRRPSVRPFTITKKSSSPKLTIRFQSHFTEMILR